MDVLFTWVSNVDIACHAADWTGDISTLTFVCASIIGRYITDLQSRTASDKHTSKLRHYNPVTNHYNIIFLLILPVYFSQATWPICNTKKQETKTF